MAKTGIEQFFNLIAGLGLLKLAEHVEELERKKKLLEDEKKREKIRDGSIDVEYRVIENNDKKH